MVVFSVVPRIDEPSKEVAECAAASRSVRSSEHHSATGAAFLRANPPSPLHGYTNLTPDQCSSLLFRCITPIFPVRESLSRPKQLQFRGAPATALSQQVQYQGSYGFNGTGKFLNKSAVQLIRKADVVTPGTYIPTPPRERVFFGDGVWDVRMYLLLL